MYPPKYPPTFWHLPFLKSASVKWNCCPPFSRRIFPILRLSQFSTSQDDWLVLASHKYMRCHCHTVTYRQIGRGCITPLRKGELCYFPCSMFNLEPPTSPFLFSGLRTCPIFYATFHLDSSQVAVYARSIKPAMCEGRTSALRFCIVLGLTSVERTQFLELLPPFLLHMTLIC